MCVFVDVNVGDCVCWGVFVHVCNFLRGCVVSVICVIFLRLCVFLCCEFVSVILRVSMPVEYMCVISGMCFIVYTHCMCVYVRMCVCGWV